tara:strand:+ start:87 stop:770 length:684 start_codon:yes stop_codon:yes gene_type:complete
MPRKTIDDYTFYKIIDKNGILDLCYVGSSVNMKKRKDAHKTACKSPNNKQHNCKIYKTIRENGGFDEFRFVEIAFREQLTLAQSHIVEDEYRVLLKAQLNTNKCHTTPEQKKEESKMYYQDHKEHKKMYSKKYRKDNNEEMSKYNKKYYEDHKEQSKKYREDNKEDLKAKASVKHICPCGGKYTHEHIATHERTQKHKTYIAEQKAFYAKLETEQNDANYVGYDEVV